MRPSEHKIPAMAGATFLALSKFKVTNGMDAEVREAFRRRPHLVDDADGFVRMDVVSPTGDDAEFWLLTYWRDEASFRQWHHGHTYRESHAGIPPGLKLAPEATELLTFRYITD
jgi:heme-degrading monooxygenase HmoA